MYKTIFSINKYYFNVTFENKNLFEKHKNLDNFEDVKTIIFFSYRSNDNITLDTIKLHATENSRNFVNYKDADMIITTTFFIYDI